MYEKEQKCKVDDNNGKLTVVYYLPNEMKKQRKRFIKEMNRQGAWMCETSFRQIIDAYEEAFEKRINI